LRRKRNNKIWKSTLGMNNPDFWKRFDREEDVDRRKRKGGMLQCPGKRG
jgi:hypothetical protein